MSADRPPEEPEGLPRSPLDRVDEACDRFEQAWRAGQRPRIEDFLAAAPDLLPHGLLRELLASELELRRAAGERPEPEEYRARFPDHTAAVAAAFEEAPGRTRGTAEQPKQPAVANQTGTDGNLLFGVLALQFEMIDAQQLAAACGEWAARKGVPLAQLLVERGWITAAEREQVEALLQRKLKRHGGDARATLGAVADGVARDAIRQVDDADVRQSVSSLPPAAGYVLISTETFVPPHGERGSRYTLTRLHAHGGLGQVWVARDTVLNRDVALKELKPAQAAHPEAWRRFLKEAQVTGQLEHPNIVPVYELARRPDDDQPFYTMRFVKGHTLQRAVAEYHEHRAAGAADPLELPKLLQAFVSVCQAIAYAHSRGVIHRDLKPANVVLGGFGEVVVLDWGLAKMVGRPDESDTLASVHVSAEADSDLTLAGQRMGSSAYMAPEQAEGRLDLIDARTDIYGLGAILFEILTGRPPHRGHQSDDLYNRIVSGETPRARTVEPTVPRALEAVCARAMAKERADRYAMAKELAEEVLRWLADEPVTAYREGWRPRLTRWGRRHRAWVQTGTAALVLITIISVAASFVVNRARLQKEKALERERVATDEANQRAVQNAALANQLSIALKDTKQESRRAFQALADFNLERGRALEERSDSRGLLWLARALASTPADDSARQDTIRLRFSEWALQHHVLKAILPSHQSAVALSPDGKTVLTGSADHTARLWSAADGTPIGQPMIHQGPVLSVAFSPDGKTVLTGSWDIIARLASARLWSAADGTPVGQPIKHQGPVSSVAFSPDGKTVLTGSEDRTARLWRVPTLMGGDPRRFVLWSQVMTGMELRDPGDRIEFLDSQTWQERRRQLEALGGPPMP